MKKLLHLIAITGMLACNNQHTTTTTTTETVTDSTVGGLVDFSSEHKTLDSALQQMQTPSQFFKAPIHHPVTFTAAKGTQIDVNGDDLTTVSGKPMGNHIDVEVKELTTPGELARNKSTTMAGDKLLVSGGAYYINMTSGGEQLKLKDGKVLHTRVGVLSKDKMLVFYGNRDKSDFVNWTLTEKAVLNPLKSASKQTSNDIDEIYAYVDTAAGDIGVTSERPAARKSVDVANMQALDMGELGWINCDRFLNEEVLKTNVSIAQKQVDSVQVFEAFLVFRDINSVMPAYGQGSEPTVFYNVPVGYKVDLVAVGYRNGRYYTYKKPLTVSAGQQVDIVFKGATLDEVKKLFK